MCKKFNRFQSDVIIVSAAADIFSLILRGEIYELLKDSHQLTVSSIFGIINGFHDLADVTYFEKYPKVAADLVKLKILFSLLDAAFGVTLLMGLYLKRPMYYLSWIISKSILLLCEIPLYILMSTFDMLCDEVGIFLFFMGLDIYGVLVVHGYFMETTQPDSSESEV